MASPPPTPAQTHHTATAEARSAFTSHLSSIGSTLHSSLQTRALDIHANSAAISKQQSELSKQTAALGKQSAVYQKLADETRERLKEIGDVQNWAEMIERDLLVVEEARGELELGIRGEWYGAGRSSDGCLVVDPVWAPR
ncbi:MAG: Biogenesis of lysosome-related organelles complex 1 subunit 1 [Lasallia pustulata]|uniref:Biogenesis of lysosome-related organelles complex 1 subunit 1 n=1 Tax=Lasallia pustulata TaxID=136370 RepID=A0A5M8PYT5_9LECA|nr:MAG: Biogenesis of lysosome-related organelles complex 1 subunit 1 [Lasallia pustulata]